MKNCIAIVVFALVSISSIAGNLKFTNNSNRKLQIWLLTDLNLTFTVCPKITSFGSREEIISEIEDTSSEYPHSNSYWITLPHSYEVNLKMEPKPEFKYGAISYDIIVFVDCGTRDYIEAYSKRIEGVDPLVPFLDDYIFNPESSTSLQSHFVTS
jgi:hypothetical protein